MPFITFIYKIRKNTYYGKYMTNCISDDHEGLDTVVRPYLVNGLNKFRKQNNLSKLKTKVKILENELSRKEKTIEDLFGN